MRLLLLLAIAAWLAAADEARPIRVEFIQAVLIERDAIGPVYEVRVSAVNPTNQTVRMIFEIEGLGEGGERVVHAKGKVVIPAEGSADGRTLVACEMGDPTTWKIIKAQAFPETFGRAIDDLVAGRTAAWLETTSKPAADGNVVLSVWAVAQNKTDKPVSVTVKLKSVSSDKGSPVQQRTEVRIDLEAGQSGKGHSTLTLPKEVADMISSWSVLDISTAAAMP